MEQVKAMDALRELSPAAEIYPDSWIKEESAFAAWLEEEDVLITAEDSGLNGVLTGGKSLGSGLTAYPMNHENRLKVNQRLPFTNPVSLAADGRTFGLGDRLGLAGYAHLEVVKKHSVKPILAQQSMRELTLTNRTWDDVLDAAVWAVVKAGWRGGFGADGDHLKTEKDIRHALECGYSMITLDCSENLKTPPSDPAELEKAYQAIDETKRAAWEQEYVGNALAEKLGAAIDKPALMRAAVAFGDAIPFITNIYRDIITQAGRRIDFEVSVDETPFETEPSTHFFVANELKKEKVVADSMAPRFVGEFQKAVDYIGNTGEFHESFRVHCAIAKEFGYRISVHSGSDKFSIYPSVAELTEGKFHVKTAGTNWLEAVRVIASEEPALYRKIHQTALDCLEEAKKLYVVDCDTNKIKPLDQVEDKYLIEYLEQNDSRQLLHITYGSLFDRGLKAPIYEALKKHRKEYEKVLDRHIGKHINLLGC